MPFKKGETPEGAMLFEKGKSGNPKGKEAGTRNRSTIIREILELMESVKNPITGEQQKLNQEQIMSLAILSKARKGDVNAYKALMDSAHGAPKQEIESTGDSKLTIVRKTIGKRN